MLRVPVSNSIIIVDISYSEGLWVDPLTAGVVHNRFFHFILAHFISAY